MIKQIEYDLIDTGVSYVYNENAMNVYEIALFKKISKNSDIQPYF